MRPRPPWLTPACVWLAVLALAACDDAPGADGPAATGASPPPAAAAPATPTPSATPAAPASPTPPTPRPSATPHAGLGDATPRPDWLGRRVLPERDDGFGEVRDTPSELTDRRLPPPDPPALDPPAGEEFTATVEPVPSAVAARSTWHEGCPVGLDELRYVTVTFWGFDDRAHTGELLVHRRAAEDVADVFARLFAARFPIEELRVIDTPELDAPPTGDGNTSTAFVCRRVTVGSSWSEHARGLAVDINPFHNPYQRGDVVVPELASAYLDRDRHRPGMIRRGDAVTEAFAAIGWDWGGDWQSSSDWMHFSASGR